MSVKAVRPSPLPPLSPENYRAERKAPDTASFVELLRLERLRSALAPAGRLQATAAPNPVVGILLQAFGRSSVSSSEASQDPPAPPPAAGRGAAEPPARHEGESRLDEIVARAARTCGLEPALIQAVIQAESGGNVRAVSPAGARGLMQLMPETSRALGVIDPFDPEQNVLAGSRFLKELLERYRGNLDSALAAYNWGPGRVDRGENPPRETREYVARVKQGYRAFVG